MKWKKIEQELVDRYCRGEFDKEHKIISCGSNEMIRFIKKIINQYATHKTKSRK